MLYCGNCDYESNDFDLNKNRNRISFMNIRDGYGRPITHVFCPNCEYPLAGIMHCDDADYAKSVIDMYSIKDGGMLQNHDELVDLLVSRRKENKR